ncbi:MAG: hypothetical protein U1E14_08090 [Geminicoccaceae bacterium]
MKPRTLALLERLERRTLERLVRELAESRTRQAAATASLTAHLGARASEVAKAPATAEGAGVIARYWLGSRAAERPLRDEADRLDAEAAALLARVTESRTEARRYERLREGLEAAERVRAGRIEQGRLDEAALLRAARRR